jgi:hypothetical protein
MPPDHSGRVASVPEGRQAEGRADGQARAAGEEDSDVEAED